MNIKKILITLVSSVLAVTIIFGVITFVKFKSNDVTTNNDNYSDSNLNEDISLNQALYNVNLKSQFYDIKENYKDIVIGDDTNDYIIYDIDFFGEKMTFIYTFDEVGYLYQIDSYCILSEQSKDISGIKLKEKSEYIISEFLKLFEYNDIYEYDIFSDSEIFDNSEESFQKISNGEAELNFKLRDKIGDLWELSIAKTYRGDLLLQIYRYTYDTETLANLLIL